jgi:hypothetical protein
MAKDRSWHGCDMSKAISLFEQGLLIRHVSKNKGWQCLYKNSVCPNMFSFGWTSEEILEEVLTTGWAKNKRKKLMENSCSYWEEWVELPMIIRIDDFIAYFGTLELFGENYGSVYTVKEMCKRLHIKYEEDYENA